MRPLNIGLTPKQRDGSIKELNRTLANEMLLLIKTRKVHWDIVGPQFLVLHKLLDEQYALLAKVVDDVAERVRALGGYPVGTAAGFLSHGFIKEHPGKVLRATGAIEMLLEDHELMIVHQREAADRCEEHQRDRGTVDFLTRLLQGHEAMAWMLRSFVEGEVTKADVVKLPVGTPPTLV
jgi:starvation-inducible DNA-binding protein